VDVQVIASNGMKSAVYTVALALYTPGFFLYQVASAKYPVAHVGNEFIGTPVIVTDLVTRPAKPGETITLYGTGFGPAAQPFASETTVTGYSDLASPGLPSALAVYRRMSSSPDRPDRASTSSISGFRWCPATKNWSPPSEV
jgi:uncharacterized protein (TIGR03437 family)